MKVAYFQFFPPTVWTPGGGEVQLAKTRAELVSRGVDVSLFDIWNPRRDHDILHVFGSTYQLSDFVVTAKRLGQRVVVSPIIYTDKPRIQWIAGRAVDYLCPFPTIYSYRRRIYEAADLLLPGSQAEARQLHLNFGVPYRRMEVIPVGVESRFLDADPTPFQERYGLRDFVLMVSRISRHKGQLRLIQAMHNTGVHLVFIGNPDPDDPESYEAFRTACSATPGVTYLGALPHDGNLLASAFASCRVHALPSLGECPGIVSMEAGLAGANVVAGAVEPVVEALGSKAHYCRPDSVGEIRRAVLSAFHAPHNGGLRDRLKKGFLWPQIGERIHQVYQSLN